MRSKKKGSIGPTIGSSFGVGIGPFEVEPRYEDGRENENTKGWNKVVHEGISFRGFGGMVKFHLLRFCRNQTGLA